MYMGGINPFLAPGSWHARLAREGHCVNLSWALLSLDAQIQGTGGSWVTAPSPGLPWTPILKTAVCHDHNTGGPQTRSAFHLP